MIHELEHMARSGLSDDAYSKALEICRRSIRDGIEDECILALGILRLSRARRRS